MIKTIILNKKQVEKHIGNLKANYEFFDENGMKEDAIFYRDEIKRIQKFLRETKIKTPND